MAVSEGVRYADGTYVGAGAQSGVADVFGHQYLSGTGKALEHLVKNRIGCKVRSVELNISQRCAAHITSATDIRESVAVGRSAVRAAVAGESGKMMCMFRKSGAKYGVENRPVDIATIANRVKTVPDSFITSNGTGITPAGKAYLMPLIMGEGKVFYKNGLPAHFILK